MDIYTISRLLGHASVTTTEKAYVGIANSALLGSFDAMEARITARKEIAAPHAAPQGGTTVDSAV